MNRTILIIIGILAALLTAAGMMWYSPTPKRPDSYYGNSRMHLSLNELVEHLNKEDGGIFDCECGCMLFEYSGAFEQYGEKAKPELLKLLKSEKWWIRYISIVSL